jgi:hypothetical protein
MVETAFQGRIEFVVGARKQLPARPAFIARKVWPDACGLYNQQAAEECSAEA